MQLGKAISAGIVGASIMTILMAIARWLGMPVNMEMMLGSMLTGVLGPGAWVIGLVMHLAIGAAFGLIYAALFERVLHRAGPGAGTMIGLVHAIITGFLLGFMPTVHPLIPEAMAPPGAFLINLGLMGVIAYIALHAIFGAVVGAYYKPVLLRKSDLAHPASS